MKKDGSSHHFLDRKELYDSKYSLLASFKKIEALSFSNLNMKIF